MTGHVPDIAEVELSARTSWIIAVTQSLFWLLTTFCHFFRPVMCLLLDHDLKSDVFNLLGGRGYSAVGDNAAEAELGGVAAVVVVETSVV